MVVARPEEDTFNLKVVIRAPPRRKRSLHLFRDYGTEIHHQISPGASRREKKDGMWYLAIFSL